MINLAEIHLSPSVTVPTLIVVGLMLAMYAWSLGHPAVPESRRHIRRLSVMLMIISLPVFAKGLSFVDGDVDPRGYAIAWTVAIGFIIVVVITAFVDMVNNLRLYRIERADQVRGAASDLVDAINEAREQRAEDESA
ncbi:MAG: hypothetical protein AAF432_07855 [Planctomycetota bacterium]